MAGGSPLSFPVAFDTGEYLYVCFKACVPAFTQTFNCSLSFYLAAVALSFVFCQWKCLSKGSFVEGNCVLLEYLKVTRKVTAQESIGEWSVHGLGIWMQFPALFQILATHVGPSVALFFTALCLLLWLFRL